MAKAVLISIRPEWVAKIIGGVKTTEVRRDRPKLEPPFKCYIYCTMPNTHDPHKLLEIHSPDGKIHRGNGNIVGEFTCTGIHNIRYEMDGFADAVDCRTTCLKPLDFIAYGKGRPLFGWDIADVEIYDEPKPLSSVWFPPETYCEKELCGGCPYDCCPSEYRDVMFDCEWKRPLKRPPQSWCYVEEL